MGGAKVTCRWYVQLCSILSIGMYQQKVRRNKYRYGLIHLKYSVLTYFLSFGSTVCFSTKAAQSFVRDPDVLQECKATFFVFCMHVVPQHTHVFKGPLCWIYSLFHIKSFLQTQYVCQTPSHPASRTSLSVQK